jgi:redox-sensitive bicupin YhaK (pirin superfamily)
LKLNDRQNKLQQILSPNTDDEGVWIHQNAWFHLGKFDKNITTDYALKDKSNGVYCFVISGVFNVDGQVLSRRDAMGIWEIEKLNLESLSENAEILLMEVPMNI